VSLAGVPQTKVHKPTGDKMEVESGGEIELKSGSTLDVQAGTAVTFAAPLALTGTYFKPVAATEAALKVSTPTVVGAVWYDSTNKEFVQSTGTTTCFDYAKIEDPTAAPDGW
jgi:phage gp45-like